MTGFGPEHLPYGVFRRAGESPRVGARLGDGVLDLAELAADGPLDEDPALFDAAVAQRVHGGRARDVGAGARGAAVARPRGPDAEPATVALDEVELLLPIAVGDYVDFYSSLDHATNVGRHLPARRRPAACPTGATCRSAITGVRARWW